MKLPIEDYKGIIWDFDGVIMDSMPVRNQGFQLVLQETYQQKDIDTLMKYHLSNGGLSRYNKFTYFLSEIVQEKENLENRVLQLAQSFKAIMLDNLVNDKLLIKKPVSYIEKNYRRQIFYVASGSDQMELRSICESLKIASFFKKIYGSPVTKIKNVETILNHSSYSNNDFCLIGDSINDYEAAETNGIDFYGYNNIGLKNIGKKYLLDF